MGNVASKNLVQKIQGKENKQQNELERGMNDIRNNFKKYNKSHRRIKICNSVREIKIGNAK